MFLETQVSHGGDGDRDGCFRDVDDGDSDGDADDCGGSNGGSGHSGGDDDDGIASYHDDISWLSASANSSSQERPHTGLKPFMVLRRYVRQITHTRCVYWFIVSARYCFDIFKNKNALLMAETACGNRPPPGAACSPPQSPSALSSMFPWTRNC